MLGNQPHVTAAKKIVDNRLDFACDGTPGNAGSHDEEHIHGWSLSLDEDGTLHYTGQLLKKNEVTEKPSFVLTRRQVSASR